MSVMKPGPPRANGEVPAVSEAKLIFVINGPNLDQLGAREPEIYGHGALEDLEQLCRAEAEALGVEISFRQDNAEHRIVGYIHEGSRTAAGIIINPAAFTHYSYSIVDALSACKCPIIEVHLTNIQARGEHWRSISLVSPVVDGVISGLGFDGYAAAIRWIARKAGPGPVQR